MEKIKAFSFWENEKQGRRFIIINLWDEAISDLDNWVVLKEIKPGTDNEPQRLSMLDFKLLVERKSLAEWN